MQKLLAAQTEIYDSPDIDDRRPMTGIYLASEVDARIAELEKALRQIATGGDPDGVGDGLDYSEISAIASRALMVSERT